MKKEGEIKTKLCSQCHKTGRVYKVFQYGAIKTAIQCPVCDGYGFVIIEKKL